MDLKLAKLRYHQQKAQSKSRVDLIGNPIMFKLSFEEWLNIWLDSGKWEQRGRKLGQYCMSRIDDIGHYEIGNITIVLSNENVRESSKRANPNKGSSSRRGPKTEEQKLKISEARKQLFKDGYKYSEEDIFKMTSHLKGKKQSNETIQKRRNSLIGKTRTPEQKENIRSGVLRRLKEKEI